MRIGILFIALLISLAIPRALMGKERQKKITRNINNKEFVEQLQRGASPIIQGNRATFVYRGDAKSVELVGEMTGWGRGRKLKKLRGQNIRYLSLQFEPDARLEYKYMVNGQWQIDPLNPNRNDNGVGGLNNYFTMPEYQPSKWLQPQTNIKQGKIEDLSAIFSTANYKRQVRVYLPPDYAHSTQHYPTIYFSDGLEYIERAHANVIVDNLIAANRIHPVIMVFIAPRDRVKEYWMNNSYVEYLIQDVVPKIDARYRTIRQGNGRAIAGASLGGLIAAYAATRRADIFGKVLGQSSSFMLNSGRMIQEVARAKRQAVQWYLEVGQYEPLLESNRRMKALLETKGYKVGYKESNAGHNWTHWSNQIADGLIFLFPN